MELGLVPYRAQRALCSLRDGFANADRCVLAAEQHAREVAALRVILQDKRLLEQPFRKVKDRRCLVAASVFGTRVATLRAVPLVQDITRTCVHGESMFFAMKFCHCWGAADFAFAFAHHLYLPPALPGHVPTSFTVLRIFYYKGILGRALQEILHFLVACVSERAVVMRP